MEICFENVERFSLIQQEFVVYFVMFSDASYSDPLGPSTARPRTSAGKPLDLDDFGDEQLGDDLLPV